MDWKPIAQTPPLNTPVLVTDGRVWDTAVFHGAFWSASMLQGQDIKFYCVIELP
jgi:hypothetical protein